MAEFNGHKRWTMEEATTSFVNKQPQQQRVNTAGR